jgi:hypothetical protein
MVIRILATTAVLLGVVASSALAVGSPTTSSISSSKNPSNAGDNVTFSVTVKGALPPPLGFVQFFDGASPLGGPQALSPDFSGTCPFCLPTNHSSASVSTSGLSVGTHTISVAYAGTDVPSGDSLQQKVNGAQSSTSVSSSTNPSVYGQNVTFTAAVTKPGGTPSGSVQFQADGQDLGGPQPVDGSGHASVDTSTLAAGNHSITATFTSSDPNTLNSSGSLAGGQTVNAASTTTGVTSSRNPSEQGQAVTFTATISTNAPGSGTPTGTVQFRDNGTDLGAPQNVDGSGKASITTSDLTVGPHTISATYTSNSANFSGSSGSMNQTVDRARTNLAYTGATSADFHDSATLSAKLTRQDDGSPVAGKSIHFTMASESCDGTTDSSGVASCAITPQETSGDYTVKSSFAGDANYQPSSDSKAFTVTREETTLTYTGDTVIMNGGTAHASALLQEDGSAPSIAGRSVTFTLGSGTGAQSCTALTDSAGRAACDIGPVSQPLGPGTIKAVFAQDAYYLASSTSVQTIVFAFPSRGAFAIGDRNAAPGASVTFFGAQWSKDNSLSGGPAPSAFKGFVTSPGNPPRCGDTFTTDPGNSGSPPATVPSFMGTLVTSKVTQTGSTIRGDIRQIVVVRTSSYGPSPGQGGTGTVVAVVCRA